MAGIFISHSSADREAAGDLARRLNAWGHASVFLDFHPEYGIPAGRDWEKELYRQLRSCRAVIAICTPGFVSSRWCFAEITHARALGKPVFPVIASACAVDPLLVDRQAVDVTSSGDSGWERLRAGLEAAGIRADGLGDWDRRRPPYPGLAAFSEQDAPVFFGRDAEVQAVLDDMGHRCRFGGARLTVLAGASGSGKSSVLRAGVLPRLRQDPARWLVVDPISPRDRPLERLARAVSAAAAPGGAGLSWETVRAALEGPGDSGRLALDLLGGARTPDATVVLAVDQMEEAFSLAGPAEVHAFLAALAALSAPGAGPWHVLATLRSDFLGSLKAAPELQAVDVPVRLLGPPGREALADAIAGPARLAGIELEGGLAGELLDDTRSYDAMPLLAFCLRELWEAEGPGGTLTLAGYRDRIGRLAGAVARSAEACVAHLDAEPARRDLMRSALLALVRLDDDGRHTRRAAPWDDLPVAVHGELGRLVEARLLISSGDGTARRLEVAHEALFRSWQRLWQWLDEEREFLLWRNRLDRARQEWERVARHPSALLEGPALAEARVWVERQGGILTAEERAFVRRSERSARRRRLTGAAAGAVLGLVLVALSAWALGSRQDAVEARVRAEENAWVAHGREVSARAALQGDAIGRVRLLVGLTREAASRPAPGSAEARDDLPPPGLTADARDMLLEALRVLPPRVASATVRLSGGPGPAQERRCNPEDREERLEFTADSRHVLVSDYRVTAVLSLAGGVRVLRHERPVLEVAATPDGEALRVLLDDGRTLETRRLADGGLAGTLALSPPGATVAPERACLAQDGVHAVLSWPEAASRPASIEVRDLVSGRSEVFPIEGKESPWGLFGGALASYDRDKLILRVRDLSTRVVGAHRLTAINPFGNFPGTRVAVFGSRIAVHATRRLEMEARVLEWENLSPIYQAYEGQTDGETPVPVLGGRGRFVDERGRVHGPTESYYGSSHLDGVFAELPRPALVHGAPRARAVLSPDGRYAALRVGDRVVVHDLDALAKDQSGDEPEASREARDWTVPARGPDLLAPFRVPVSESKGDCVLSAAPAPGVKFPDGPAATCGAAVVSPDGRFVAAQLVGEAALTVRDRVEGTVRSLALDAAGTIQLVALNPGHGVLVAQVYPDIWHKAVRYFDWQTGRVRCEYPAGLRVWAAGRWIVWVGEAPKTTEKAGETGGGYASDKAAGPPPLAVVFRDAATCADAPTGRVEVPERGIAIMNNWGQNRFLVLPDGRVVVLGREVAVVSPPSSDGSPAAARALKIADAADAQVVALSADGSRLALGGGTIHVLDAASLRELQRFRFRGVVKRIVFSPDNGVLLVREGFNNMHALLDGPLHRIPLRWSEVVKQAETRVAEFADVEAGRPADGP